MKEILISFIILQKNFRSHFSLVYKSIGVVSTSVLNFTDISPDTTNILILNLSAPAGIDTIVLVDIFLENKIGSKNGFSSIITTSTGKEAVLSQIFVVII